MTGAMIKLPEPTIDDSDPKALAAEILTALRYRVGKDATVATPYDWLTASIKVVGDRIIEHWIDSTKEAYDKGAKRVYYLSLEFLIGRLLRAAFLFGRIVTLTRPAFCAVLTAVALLIEHNRRPGDLNATAIAHNRVGKGDASHHTPPFQTVPGCDLPRSGGDQ